MNTQLVRPLSASRTRALSSNLPSISMAMTSRAILDNCNVNKPSPEHRSTTIMPAEIPTSLTTFAGSGHKASQKQGSGIPVPWKKPGSIVLSIRRQPHRADGLSSSVGASVFRSLRLHGEQRDALHAKFLARTLGGVGNELRL